MEKKFVIPDRLQDVTKHIVTHIIENIPDEWQVLRGTLHAPQYMLNSGEASRTTGLVFASSIDQMIAKFFGEDRADIFEVLIKGKKPKTVEFGKVFGCCEVMPMSQSKLMTAHFVNLDYNGRLTFGYRDLEDDRAEAPECRIWIPGLLLAKNDSKVVFKVSSEDNFHDLERIAPILKICESLLSEVTTE